VPQVPHRRAAGSGRWSCAWGCARSWVRLGTLRERPSD
jgi:hypothetical protein